MKSQDNLKQIITEIRKLAKRHTRDKSKKQFDEELFGLYFLEYIKEKKIKPDIIFQIASEFMQSPDNFDKDMAIFIINAEGVKQELILNFIEKNLPTLNEEQTSSIMFLVNKYHLENLYYPVFNHLKFNSFYGSESLRSRFTYTGILFEKEEGYKELEKELEKELLIINNTTKQSELYTGNVLFLLIANKNYKNIERIFQHSRSQKKRTHLEQQTLIAAKRWNAGFKERLMIKKAIVTAQIKNFIKLEPGERRKN
ncbi:hypothetical protein LEP1GSC162_3464 [Leptospira santarosai str. CBC1531]|uniref:hypothetical protein n=1 Tax=Leptospira santarosai TaxID=28183 RepID=UPI0002BDA5A5|nr:hypothetical protein [Leptospira santarosai]EMP81636.1 hypothetical protein LEP1GSC162_3464 [Leptospira santarosai str. CBC1531]